MGYGTHAMQLLKDYYDGQFISLSENGDDLKQSSVDSLVEEVCTEM